jgi:predicted ATP-binding protein involved in virulence
VLFRSTRWIARQSWITYQQQNRVPPAFTAVKTAVVGCVENAVNLYFDAVLGEVVVEMQGGAQPFSNLSDGQRTMLAMVGDIAQKAAKLNPHLGDRVLEETPGVVLVDELDLHLHPKWQRRVIEDLRRTFPKIQFICTTHSPQLIGQAKADEIIVLDAPESSPHPGQSFGMDSNWVLRHIMGSDDRDASVAAKLDEVFAHIEEARFEEAQEAVKALRAEIGEHPELVEAEALIGRYSRFEKTEAE